MESSSIIESIDGPPVGGGVEGSGQKLKCNRKKSVLFQKKN